MNSNLLIYYLFKLIKDGHEWQYKNLNGKGKQSKLYFSSLQIIALCISILFCISVPQGLTTDATDHILTCLSIMVALFLSLIIVVFDKSKQKRIIKSKSGEDVSSEESEVSVTDLHLWNFFYQFNALTSYAILLSIFVIILILITLIFDIKVDLSQYYIVPYNQWNKNNIFTALNLTLILLIRFCIVYFLIDFFIICFYAICHMYQYIRLDFLKRRPGIQIYNEENISETFKREYGINISTIKGIIAVVIGLIAGVIIWNFFTT
ncbi:MAG: hypothetical protein KIH02_02165 [Parabacteroides sp.]|nr:hypothetical protein [Parabacteroides sp.]